jgi:cathepsin B
MANLKLFIYISLIFNIMTNDSFKISKEHIEGLKQVSNFKVIDYDNHPFKDWTFEEMKSLTGAVKNDSEEQREAYKFENSFVFLDGSDKVPIPNSFDVRDFWADCIFPIRHQRRCGSCWAHVGAQMLSYKFCIQTKGAVKVRLSVQDLVSCNLDNNGCEGSKASVGWDYMMKEGIVAEDCLPYISENGIRGHCPLAFGMKICAAGVFKKYKAQSKYFLRTTYEDVKRSIMKDGPIHAYVNVYQDFMSYGGGIYVLNPQSKFIGHHSVMITGWGVENNVQYWVGVNSWGTTWGENGYFKIAFGQIDIEQGMWSGTANIDDL